MQLLTLRPRRIWYTRNCTWSSLRVCVLIMLFKSAPIKGETKYLKKGHKDLLFHLIYTGMYYIIHVLDTWQWRYLISDRHQKDKKLMFIFSVTTQLFQKMPHWFILLIYILNMLKWILFSFFLNFKQKIYISVTRT